MEDREAIEKKGEGIAETAEHVEKEEISPLEAELAEMKDRYLRLYAEFENYKKRVKKEKEDLVKCGISKKRAPASQEPDQAHSGCPLPLIFLPI